MSGYSTRRINDIGIGLAGRAGDHIADIRIYPEGTSVQLWVDVDGRELMQYLTPQHARQFAAALLRGAAIAQASCDEWPDDGAA